MKKPISTTGKFIKAILILVALFFITSGIFAIDDSSPIAVILCCVVALGIVILIPAFIYHLSREAAKKIRSKHKEFKSENLKRVNPGGRVRFAPIHRYYIAGNAPVSWATIFMTLLVLFPIGIFFMLRKVMYEKTRYIINGTTLLVGGSVMTLVALPAVLFAATSGGRLQDIFLGMGIPTSFMLIGIGMIITGAIVLAKGRKYEKYVILIAEYKITNLDIIKKEFKTTYADVTETLEKMMDAGLLPDCYIYHKNKEIIVPGISEEIAIKCKTCMGTTVLYSNDERICVYCGGRL